MKKRVFRSVALILLAVTLLPLFSACGGDAVTAITVNGEPVKKTDFMMHLFVVKTTLYQSQLADGTITYEDLYHLNEETLNEPYSQGYTFADYLKSSATSAAVSAALYRSLAAEEGITLTKAEKQEARRTVNQWKENMGGGQAYNIFLRENRITDNAMYRYYCDMTYMNKLKAEFGDYGKYAMSEEDLTAAKREYYDTYYTVDYIFFSKRDQQVGMLLSEEDIAAKYAQAKECLSRLKAGEDFYALRKEYSDEEYKTVTFCDGMLSSQIFADTSMSLRVNSFSDVINDEANYCYFILHRIETNAEKWETQYSMIIDANFNAFVNQYASTAEVVYKSAYNSAEIN